MFSTVDSPGARFVRVILIQADGTEIPVLLPEQMEDKIQELRTMPTQQRLHLLATAVAQGEWAPYRMAPAVQQYQSLLYQAPILDFETLTDFHRQGPAGNPIVDEMSNSLYSKGYVSFEKFDFYRMLDEGEPPPSPDGQLAFEQTRIEVWRYQFDARSQRLYAEEVMATTVVREEG